MTTIFDFLNIVGLVGWATVLGCLIVQWYEPLNTLLFALEGICVLEVTRIAVGQLPGNLTLGIVLHGIRFTNLLYVLPSSKYWGGGEETVESSDNASNEGSNFLTMDTLAWLVLYSWAITEVTRYPMYILTNNPTARFVRLTVPLVTFPVGAFAEGYASHLTLAALFAKDPESMISVKNILLLAVVVINGVLGPTMAYPFLLKKGVPVLLGKEKPRKSKKT